MSTCDSIQPRDDVHACRGSDEQIEKTLASTARTVTITNSLGLHMRPVMQFVDLANQFRAHIRVTKKTHAVDGKNPMELMLLEATQGTELEIRAEGEDADSAADALVDLVRTGFGED